MDVYSSQPYCISFFYLQIKPFYMLAEIEQTGRKPLTIQQEMFRDADKIF